MPPIPVDDKLYNKIKLQVYKDIPKHSAYRSGIVVSKYKSAFQKKYGPNRSPYHGNKNNSKGLGRWFKEEWVNQRGETGYKFKNDIYRPKKRINKKTPLTHDELSNKEVKRARTEKYNKGRVFRFKNTRKNTGGKINKTRKNINILPPLRKVDDKNKKYKYKINNSTLKRKLAINEGVRSEADKMNIPLKDAAIKKKGRFNILRIYRKNNFPQQCKVITKDMKYIDQKYGLNKTTDIC